MTTVFRNSRIRPVGRSGPESDWVLVRDGRIEALGQVGEAAPRGTGITEVDLGGRTVIPGPVDAHCHLVSYGMIQSREADLRGVTSLAELTTRLRDHCDRLGLRPGDGRWLLGRGFDQELMEGGRWPDGADLDHIAPDRPLRITRICGHALVANTAAHHRAGLEPAAQPGFPPGVLTEERMAPVHAAVPAPSAEDWRRAAAWACAEAARVGFVGVHSLMADAEEMQALRDLDAAGALPIRVQMQPPYALLEQLCACAERTGAGSAFLTLGAIKLFSDGSLGARTAALRDPYSDDPSTSGELIYPPEELAARVERVLDAGFQVCVHAIGDRAMEVTLDAMERGMRLLWSQGRSLVAPCRIEHASVVDRGLVHRMMDLGIGAAVQPQFARSDYWAPERLGTERVRGCYAFRTLWEGGVPLAGSTDCPVEPLDAMAAIGQMVHRPDWSPDEGIPLDATLQIFSEGSYALQGYRRPPGGWGPGRRADFVVLDRNPWRTPPEELEGIPIGMTVVDGRIVYGG